MKKALKFLTVVMIVIIGWLATSNYNIIVNKPSKNLSIKYNKENIPVLMYHSIGTAKLNPYVVSTNRLNMDMQYLKDNGFTTLSTDELYDFMTKNKPIPKKSVLITFDDCYEDNYTNAFPILKRYNFKATIFVITGFVDKGKQFLTSSQLKEMQKNGIDIESHTNLHEKLGTCAYNSQLITLKISKEYIKKTLNKPVKYISYPYGSYNSDTLKAVKTAGYKMAFTTNGRWANISNGILSLNRVFISGFHHSNSFKTRVNHSWYLFKDLYF